MEQARGRGCGKKELQQLKAAWQRLNPTYRPKSPLKLWRLIRYAHDYPFTEIYLADSRQSQLDHARIVDAYNSFKQSAEHLLNTLDGLARHEYLLSGSFTENLPFEIKYGLHSLERNLPDLAALPYLATESKRLPREKPDAYAKAITLIVGWYITRDEHRRFSTTVGDDGVPTSRAGILTLATLNALGIPFEIKLETMLTAARNRLNSNLNPLSQSDIFRTLGLALRQ